MFNYTVQLPQSQGIQSSLLYFGAFDPTSDLFYLNCCHLTVLDLSLKNLLNGDVPILSNHRRTSQFIQSCNRSLY